MVVVDRRCFLRLFILLLFSVWGLGCDGGVAMNGAVDGEGTSGEELHSESKNFKLAGGQRYTHARNLAARR